MFVLRKVSALVAVPALAAAVTAQLPAVGPAVPASPVASPLPAPGFPLAAQSAFTAPIPAAPNPPGIAPYPAPPGPTTTLASFLGLSQPQIEYRQRARAETPLGQVRSSLQNPISKLTNGLVPPFPPETPTLAELMDPGAVGAAAKVKQDRLAAGKRMKAVQYLGTVDCHYWPEAEEALVGALRADRNEWVRLCAAKTLARGCCCTKKTITALTMVVSCSNADGNPVEKSPKVIAAAQAALAKCLASACAAYDAGTPIITGPEDTNQKDNGGQGERPGMIGDTSKAPTAGEEKGPGNLPANQIARPTGKSFYEKVNSRPWPEIFTAARNALATAPKLPPEAMLASADQEMEALALGDARTATPHQANLLDILLGHNDVVQATAMSAPTPAPMVIMNHAPATPTQTTVVTRTMTMPTPAPATSMTAKTTTPPVVNAPKNPMMMAPATAATTKSTTPAPLPTTATTTAMTPVKPTTTAPIQAATATTPVKPVSTGSEILLTESSVEKLTAAEIAGNAGLASRLVKFSETGTDHGMRAACVRAIARGKVTTPEAMAALERLVNDRTIDVRVEAAVALDELKKAKK